MDTPPIKQKYADLDTLCEMGEVDPDIVLAAFVTAMLETKFPPPNDELDLGIFTLGFIAGKLYEEHQNG